MVLCVFVITIFLPKQARFRFEYEKGKTWMQKDLYSPYNFAIQKTDEEIETDENDILNSVLPVYQHDVELANKTIEAFNSEFETKWKRSGIDITEKEQYRSLGKKILQDIYNRGLINPLVKYQKNGPNYNFSILNNNVSTDLNTADAYTINSATSLIKEQIRNSPKISNSEWLLRIITNHLKANFIYDEILTQKLEENALNNISKTRGMVQKGELIIAKGNMVNETIYQKLESLREAYEEDAKEFCFIRPNAIGRFNIVSVNGISLSLQKRYLY